MGKRIGKVWKMQADLMNAISSIGTSNEHPERIDVDEFSCVNEEFYNSFVKIAFNERLRFKARQEKDRQTRKSLHSERKVLDSEKPDIGEMTAQLFSLFDLFLEKGRLGKLTNNDFNLMGIGLNDWKIVRHASVSHIFASYLPSRDPSNCSKYFRIGKLIVIFFIFELLVKARDRRIGELSSEFAQCDFSKVSAFPAFDRLVADYQTCNQGIRRSDFTQH
jgi:hypothetical protein